MPLTANRNSMYPQPTNVPSRNLEAITTGEFTTEARMLDPHNQSIGNNAEKKQPANYGVAKLGNVSKKPASKRSRRHSKEDQE